MSKYGDMLDEMHAEVRRALNGDKRHVFYSAYETDADGDPINNLHEVAVRGTVKLVGIYDDFWAHEEGEQYVSEVMKDPTWLEVAVAANAMIETTKDFHHSFLEGLHPMGHPEGNPDIMLYEFSMGS